MRRFIAESHAHSNSTMWDSFDDRIDIVLGHPNDWGMAQQAKMRIAATNATLKAGILSDPIKAAKRISFVTEGEASFHFCVESRLISDVLKVS